MDSCKKEFNQIYDQYIEKIYRFIFLKVDSIEVCQDLTAETFTRLWQELNRNNKIEHISGFLYRVARNLVIDYYRQRNKNPIVSADSVSIIDEKNNPHKKAEQSSDLEMVKKAMNNLKEDYKDVIIWRYLNDLSISEIAQIVNKSESAVRVTLSRALTELKKHFEEA